MIKLTGNEKTTWDWVSKYIRLRDTDDNGYCTCCTCGTVKHWKDMQAGHFRSRKHNATAWDSRNIHAQCVSCNKFNDGEQFIHGQYIDKIYGDGTAPMLLAESKKTRKNPTDEELDEIKMAYRAKIDKLDNKYLLKE